MPNFIDTPGLWLFELHVFVEGFLLKEAADVRGAVIEVLVHELRLQSYNISMRKTCLKRFWKITENLCGVQTCIAYSSGIQHSADSKFVCLP